MAIKKIILDANVVAKWYLKEVHNDKALRLRDAHVSGRVRIAVPALLIYEVLNALRSSRRFTEDELVDLSQSLELYGFEEWGLTGSLRVETVRTSIRVGITVYDASYLALASTLKVPFYTADEELAAKAGATDQVRLIGQIQTD